MIACAQRDKSYVRAPLLSTERNRFERQHVDPTRRSADGRRTYEADLDSDTHSLTRYKDTGTKQL